MIRKALIILMIYSIARFAISCCNGGEGFMFDYSKITLTAGDKIVQNLVNQADSVFYSDFIVQMDFSYIEIAHVNRNSSFDLYAYDCRSIYESVKKIKDLQIITLGDFNDQYLAGTEVDVNYKIYGYTDMDFTGSKDFVINHLNNATTKEPDEIVYFKFKDKPKVNDYHKFTVNVIFDDNSSLTDTTGFIYLKE